MNRWGTAFRFIVIAVAITGVAVVGVQVLLSRELQPSPGLPVPAVVGLAALSIVIQLAAHLLRSYKQQLLLRQIRPTRTARVFEGQMIGFLFNTILPFRLGELIRAHYIGRAISISRSAVFATILFERLIDSIVLVGAGIVVSLVLGAWIPAVATAVSWIALLAMILGFVLYAARVQQRAFLHAVYHTTGIFNGRIRDRLRMIAWSIIYVLRTSVTRQRLKRYVLLSLVMWIGYFLSVFVFVIGVAPSLGLVPATRTSVAAFLSVSVPSGPAYLGTYGQLFAATRGLSNGVLRSTGLALATWALITFPSGAIGMLLLLTRQFAPRGSASDRTTALENKLYRDVDITSEFSHFLDAYFRNDEITKILSNQEIRGRFRVLRTFKGGSNALTMLASENGETVVKKITLPQYAQKMADQYDWLARRSDYPQVARVIGPYEQAPDYVSINIEFRPDYQTFFDFIHSNSVDASEVVLRHVWQFMSANIYRPVTIPADRDARLRSYIDSKILQKAVDASKNSFDLTRLLSYERITVNGREIANLEAVLQRIDQDPRMTSDLATFSDCVIHGDLTVDNLMVEPATGEFLVLDPNNENAISDPVVDGGKLLQSFHSGYEFLTGLTTVAVRDDVIMFEENRSVQYARLDQFLRELLAEQLEPARWRSLLFHEAVHYFRMLTYRVNIDSTTAPAFYAVAVRLLNDYVDQYDAAHQWEAASAHGG